MASAALGKASSGTGSTQGGAGGSLDITPSGSLPNFTPQFVWNPNVYTFNIPARTATVGISQINGANSTPQAIYWPGQGFFTSNPFGAQTVYATPSGSWPQTINGSPTGATNANFPAENPAYQVVNYLVKE